MKSSYLAPSIPTSKATSRARIYLCAAVMAAVFALSGGRAHAAVTVQLSPSLVSPQPVGTTVTWTATVTDTNPGAYDYMFSVSLSGGGNVAVRDFAAANSFKWTPSEREGSFDVRVIARNTTTGETTPMA